MVHRTAGRLEKQLRLEPRGKPRPNHRNGQLALPLPDSLLAWQRWDAYCPLLTPTLSSLSGHMTQPGQTEQSIPLPPVIGSRVVMGPKPGQ